MAKNDQKLRKIRVSTPPKKSGGRQYVVVALNVASPATIDRINRAHAEAITARQLSSNEP